jgi:predicted acylesterase/phospholipase RssA/CRP-like cAMP-binding protein
MSKQKFEAIRESQIGCGLSDEQIQLVADAVDWVEYQSGDVIFQQDDPGDSMLLVAEGRVKISVLQDDGTQKFVDYLNVGEHFGEMAILTGQVRALTMEAVIDLRLLELKRADFQLLLEKVPRLAANVSRALGYRLRRETTGRRIRNVSRVIGIVNPAGQSSDQQMYRRLVTQLAGAFAAQQISIRIVTDNADAFSNGVPFPISEIPRNMNPEAKSTWVRQRLSEDIGHSGLTLVCLSNPHWESQSLNRVLIQSEQVLWLATPQSEIESRAKLEALLRSESQLTARTHWGWLLPEDFKPENIPPSPTQLSQPDFKIMMGQSGSPSRLERMSISRLVRFFRKTRLGLALGGGAARGLAHLGVLKAFENEGIFFDVIAGTSAGALMAVPYAYGVSPDECTEAFRDDLTPGWFFRQLPKGNQWYMLYQFRMKKWDALLRSRVADVKLEQLLTPVSTVAADLITGRQVVRDRGDATHAILESINLPSISKPIMRDGMALVDGGIINNIPSDVLPERGADLVVGVDIANQLALQFGKNTPGMNVEQMRVPGQLNTVMRSTEVQSHQITALRTKTVDQMISVDTSMFDFADFSSAREMSAVGEEAAGMVMEQFKTMIKQKSEPQLLQGQRFVCNH